MNLGGINVILYYAFDREMLNAVGFLEKDKESQRAITTIIENELKLLIFIMPLDERVIISPSFRFESQVCRKILERNRAFTDNGIIAEYRRETSEKDFWLKKNETYHKAMAISDAYRKAYGQEDIYKEISSIWIDRIPKQRTVGLISRDSFMENIKKQGERFHVPSDKIEDVIKITDETREDTFLWEMEEYMLHKYGISNRVIRRLNVRDSMNQSYLYFFADQGIKICKSSLGLVDIEHISLEYDMNRIKAILDRLEVMHLLTSLSAEKLLLIRKNSELQNMLDILREHLTKNTTIVTICKDIMKFGNIASLISKLILQSCGGNNMNISDPSIENKILRDDTLKILHLSDLHFVDQDKMEHHYFFLKLDLELNFKIKKIDYLVISGDVCDRPVEQMYKVAVSFVQILIKEFDIPIDHIILVPGNHDCDREISKEGYDSKSEKIIDQDKYNNRYIGYSKYFYEPIKGKSYPMQPSEQFEDFIFNEDSLCFLGLNSCWKIDHKYPKCSSICMKAIQNSKTIWLDTNDYVKLAVWHHPLLGEASIEDITFMDTLASAGFSASFHGHIHEAKNELFTYDAYHSIKMIGAGTFGAVQKERGDGIPRQYNLIELDTAQRILIVHTRKREKDNGTWQADARWEDKNNNPQSYYIVKCK